MYFLASVPRYVKMIGQFPFISSQYMFLFRACFQWEKNSKKLKRVDHKSAHSIKRTALFWDLRELGSQGSEIKSLQCGSHWIFWTSRFQFQFFKQSTWIGIRNSLSPKNLSPGQFVPRDKLLAGWGLIVTGNKLSLGTMVMGQTPFYRTWTEFEHHFSNIKPTRTCSCIGDQTQTPYFWLRTNEHWT